MTFGVLKNNTHTHNVRCCRAQAAEAGGCVPPKIVSERDVPLKFCRGKQIEKYKENERKIKKSSTKIFHIQKTNGPKPMSFEGVTPPTPNFLSLSPSKIFELPPPLV